MINHREPGIKHQIIASLELIQYAVVEYILLRPVQRRSLTLGAASDQLRDVSGKSTDLVRVKGIE